jgi:2-methylcitrate dehydratase
MDETSDPRLAALAEHFTIRIGEHRAVAPDALATARACVLDALGSAFDAVRQLECARLLGPIVPGATMIGGARVPGTSYELDPVEAAFDIGVACSWSPWTSGAVPAAALARDVLGGLLAVADWHSRCRSAAGQPALALRDLLAALAAVHALPDAPAPTPTTPALSLEAGAAAILRVRIATAASAAALLGGTRRQVADAVSRAVLDGAPIHAARWAAAEAASRGVRLALLTLEREPDHAAQTLAAPYLDALFGATPVMALPPVEAAPTTHAAEALAAAQRRFTDSVADHFPARQGAALVALVSDVERLDAMPAHEFVSATVRA